MAKEIIWSDKAEASFDQVIDYLNREWSKADIVHFVRKTYAILDLLERGNVSFRRSKKKYVHEVLITKHNLLIYREQKGKNQLLSFFDTRQHPRKKVTANSSGLRNLDFQTKFTRLTYRLVGISPTCLLSADIAKSGFPDFQTIRQPDIFY